MRLRNSPCIDPAVLLSSPTKASRAFRPSRLVRIGAIAETLSDPHRWVSIHECLSASTFPIFSLKYHLAPPPSCCISLATPFYSFPYPLNASCYIFFDAYTL